MLIFCTFAFAENATCDVVEVARLLGNDQPITSIALNPMDQNIAVVTDQKKQIIAWNIQSKTKLWASSTPKRVYAISFSHDGKLVFVGGRYQMLRAYSTMTGDIVTEFEKDPSRHRTVHQYIQSQFSKEYLYTVATFGDEILSANSHFPEIHESVRERLRENSYQGIMKWDVESGDLIYSKSIPSDSLITSIGFTDDEKYFYTVSAKQITVREALSGDLLKKISLDSYSEDISQPVIISATFNRNLGYLALSLVNGVTIIDTESGEVITTLEMTDEYRPKSLSFSDDGTEIIGLVARNGAVAIVGWNILSSRKIFDLPFKANAQIGSSDSGKYVSEYGTGPLIKMIPEKNLLIHAFPGEFGPGGNMNVGGSGIIVRKIER